MVGCGRGSGWGESSRRWRRWDESMGLELFARVGSLDIQVSGDAKAGEYGNGRMLQLPTLRYPSYQAE